MRIKGKRYKTIATVLKVKKGIPTVLEINGLRYVLDNREGKP